MDKNKKPAKTAEELREENKKSLWEKLEDRRKKIFLQMNKDRPLSLLGAFFISCLLIIIFLCLIIIFNPPENATTCSKKILGSLRDYSTIILAIASLPIASVLWLFRNHDIVMNLDLTMYHEALKNIHNENASVGLRLAVLRTLIELRGKWMWKEKIDKIVLAYTNLKGLDLNRINLKMDDLKND